MPVPNQNHDQTVDTIAAVATPPGRGGIGVVRLSGPQAIDIAARLVRVGSPLDHAQVRFARILDPSDPSAPPIDEALITAFHAPHSYTGETVVEIAAHGSPTVLEALLGAAIQHGARLAGPGEFTQRAFLAGRLDLTQAEAVGDLIAAQTLDAARVAAQQLGGALSRRIAPAKEALVELIALLEAGMDFASGELDDVDVVAPEEIAQRIAAARDPLQALAGTFRVGQLLRNGASLALIGLPNAGKSSLFNRLLGRDRAIVTPVAGTTRDTVEEILAIRGIPVRLIDTAGLRDDSASTATHSHTPATTLDEAEALGIARSREALADADVVLLVHDATSQLDPEERAVLDALQQRPHLLVLNKSDLLPAGEHPLSGNSASTHETVSVSARTGENLDHLKSAILQLLNAGDGTAAAGSLNNLRQQTAVNDAIAALDGATAANATGLPHEILLMELHTSLRALDTLTGATTADDILARIFSTFCIGK
jgi:tRNA modification GTPase